MREDMAFVRKKEEKERKPPHPVEGASSQGWGARRGWLGPHATESWVL